MRRSTIGSVFVLIAVLGTLTAGGVGTVVLRDEAPLLDNRELVAWPEFEPASVLDSEYYGEISAYLQDRLVGREVGIETEAEIGYEVFGDSSSPRVVVGERPWLYYTDSLTVEDSDPSPADVAAGLDRLAGVLEAAGKRLVVSIAPNKAHIYPEHVPGRLATNAEDANAHTDLLRDALSGYEWFVDVQPLMLERAEETLVYHPNDTHWNDTGGSVWIEAVVDHLAPGLWSEDALVADGVHDHPGDLARFMGIELPLPTEAYRVDRPGVEVEQTIIETDGPPWLLSTATGAPMAAEHAVIIHDSFVVAIREQTAPYFGEVLFANTNSAGDDDFVQAVVDADVVILEVVEREAYRRFQPILTSGGALGRLKTALAEAAP